MVWFVGPIEIADESGQGIGRFRLVAISDDGGGRHGLCQHEHLTGDEAYNCPDAIRNEKTVIGIGRDEVTLREHVFDAETFAMLRDAAQNGNIDEVKRLLGVQ